MRVDLLRRGLAEFVGTFTLIFVGAGAVMTAAGIGDRALIGVAAAQGFAIAVMFSAVGHISGGHFNPAVTLAFVVTRRINPLLAIGYWIAQLAGALVGALLLKWIFPDQVVDGIDLGVPKLTVLATWPGVTLEAILTFLLVWVFFATAVDPRGAYRSIAGLAIGLTITIDIVMAGPLTGAAMNPARAFGPQLVQNAWADGWIWYAGPAIGAVVAALLYQMTYLRLPKPEPVSPPEARLDEPPSGETAVP